MPHQALAAHLEAAAPTVTSPWHFLAIVFAWLQSTASTFIDTPEERAAIVKTVMDAYDRLTQTLAAGRPALALLFAATRPMVAAEIDRLLLYFVIPPAPTPAPQTVPVDSAAPA